MKKIKLEHVGLFLIFVVLPLSILIGSLEEIYVKKNGVYSIATIDKVGGRTATMYYFYKGERYAGGTDPYAGGVGTRIYMMLVPSNPQNFLLLGIRVPSWFTLDAPPEGWATKPTLADLRKMMVADSISRGLKVADTLSKE